MDGSTSESPGSPAPTEPPAPTADFAPTATEFGPGPGPDETATYRPGPAAEGARFQILAFHKQGGLGRVWVALDRELNRKVALKEIRPERADDPDSRARFVLEAEITGNLEHPGVVPVYGLGRDSAGRPLYAMRLIHGRTLKDAVAALHRDRPGAGAGAEDGRRARRELLRRFADVCLTVAYAHDRGVVHLDMKPSNLLLGEYGETLVIDWGLARATGRSGPEPPTVEGLVRPASPAPSDGPGARVEGTPPYMSPEQARGDAARVGPASDVYGLGATLYTVLTGRPPFPHGAQSDTRARVARGDFPRPRQVDRRVAPALEAVCLKAMALDPADRYASARALADDLRRWLDDAPVSAYRDPLPARARRWARRHKTAVTAAAVLLATSAVGLTAHAVRLDAARRLARANFDRARTSADRMLGWVARAELAYAPGAEATRLDVAAEGAATYRQFLRSYPDDPAVVAAAARAFHHAANVYRFNDRDAEALPLYREAVARLGGLAARPGAAAAADRLELADTLVDLGELHRLQGRLGAAEAAYDDARARLAAGPRRDDPAAEARASLIQAQVDIDRAAALLERGKFDAARAAAGRAADRLAAAPEPARDNPLYLVMARTMLATACRELGQAARAAAAVDEALKLSTPLARDERNNDANYGYALALAERGQVLRASGRPADAVGPLTDAVARLTRVANAKPATPFYRLDLAVAYAARAEARRTPGRPPGPRAQADAAKALELHEGLLKLSRDRPLYRFERARAHALLGRLALDRDDTASAVSHFTEAARLHAANLQADPDRPADGTLAERARAELSLALQRPRRTPTPGSPP